MVDGAEQAAPGNADESQVFSVHEQLRRMVHCLHAQLLIIPDAKENQAAATPVNTQLRREV